MSVSRFNSRTREGCDDDEAFAPCKHQVFQFTHPGGVRLKPYLLDLFAIVGFQFTHPGGVRRLSNRSKVGNLLFQFTHPGGVRPCYTLRATRCRRVSIHAPGRGATIGFSLPPSYPCVSIHAPGRGATQHPQPELFAIGVSIHAPGRGATDGVVVLARHGVVSIHAPGRGATEPPAR